MSIVNWDKDGHFLCPHCKKKVLIAMQNTEGYGTNVYIYDKKGNTLEIKWVVGWG